MSDLVFSRSVAINTLTRLTRTLKIAAIMLTGKMFSEYSVCDKQALIKLLKAKRCTKDEIDTFIAKSMISNKSTPVEKEISASQFSSALFHRVKQKLIALKDNYISDKENLNDSANLYREAAQKIIEQEDNDESEEAGDEAGDEAGNEADDRAGDEANKDLERAVKKLKQQLQDDKLELINEALVRLFNKYFAKVIGGNKVDFYEFAYDKHGKKSSGEFRPKQFMTSAFEDCFVQHRGKPVGMFDFWKKHALHNRMNLDELDDKKVIIEHNEKQEPIFELLCKQHEKENELFIFTKDFIDPACLKQPKTNEQFNGKPNAFNIITATDFFRAYAKWAKDNGKTIISADATRLGELLERCCPSVYGKGNGTQSKANKLTLTTECKKERVIWLLDNKEHMEKMLEGDNFPGHTLLSKVKTKLKCLSRENQEKALKTSIARQK